MTTEVRIALERDCFLLVANMSREEKAFIRRHWGVTPMKGLKQSLASSPQCWSIFVDEDIAGMFGCTEEGVVWLSTAPTLWKARIRFIRQSRKYINQMLKRHERLVGFVHEENRLLLQWLKWCGFEEQEPLGVFRVCVLRRH